MKKRNLSPMATYVLLLISLVAAAFMGWVNPVPGSDLFLCFAAGREHLDRGPAAPDRWSFTAPGRVWVDQGWLSHITLFLVLREFGWAGPVFLKLILLAACLFVLGFRCRQLGMSEGMTIFSLYLGSMAAYPFVGLRAENFGVLAFVVFAWLISRSDSQPMVRRLALPLVVLVWSNLHGSFILGLGLLGIKLGLVSVRALFAHLSSRAGPASWRIAWEWTAVLVVTVLLVSWVNPYGTANILMPFVQVGTGLVTATSSDWMPLIHPDQMTDLMGKGTVYCYVFFLSAVVSSLLVLLGTHEGSFSPLMLRLILGRPPDTDPQPCKRDQPIVPPLERPGLFPCTSAKYSTDWLMEAMIVATTVLLAFRFKRFIHFSAFALVPTAAMVFTLLQYRVIRRWSKSRAALGRLGLLRRITPLGALALSFLMAWLCYRVSILPYVTTNPFRPERPVFEDLVSYDTFSRPLIPFLTRNQIKGKVLAGWEISAFLLFYVPDFKVFMDVRDQSYYPPQIIRDYLRIMGVIPEHEETRRNLIERYGVSTIVMSTGPYDFDLSQDLLKTRRWSCIYSDNYSVVLIRSDSVEFADMLRRASFEGLWYPDRATKARSEALQSLFAFGTIRPEVMNELRSIVLSQPSPTLYGYIVAGTNPRGARLDQATVHYLVSEAERLSKISPAHRHGAEEVTGSLIAILGMLEANAYSCGQTDQYQKFALRKEALIRHRIELERYYSGHLF